MHKLSLILPTLNTEVAEFARLLYSLAAQSYPNFEVILVDQNSDQRIQAFVDANQFSFPISIIPSSPGLSHARNVGLANATGDLLAFPDDDCWYAEDHFEKAVTFLNHHPEVDGISGRAIDEHGVGTANKWDSQAGRVSLWNVWKRAVSITIFLRREVVQSVGEFDECLGLGSKTPWLSGEETDYMIRAIKLGFNIQYLPDLTVYHPNIVSYDAAMQKKALVYGRGGGRVLRKHEYPLWFYAYRSARVIGGMAKSAARRNSGRFHFLRNLLLGEFQGYFGLPTGKP